MKDSSDFIRKRNRQDEKKTRMNIDRSSITNRAGKKKGTRDVYICGISLSILNCRYINGRIISDLNKLWFIQQRRDEMKEDVKKKNIAAYTFSIWESLYNEFNSPK